jgi:hypothetical protein
MITFHHILLTVLQHGGQIAGTGQPAPCCTLPFAAPCRRQTGPRPIRKAVSYIQLSSSSCSSWQPLLARSGYSRNLWPTTNIGAQRWRRSIWTPVSESEAATGFETMGKSQSITRLISISSITRSYTKLRRKRIDLTHISTEYGP